MGHRTITKTISQEVHEDIPICDLCQKDVTVKSKSSCPSDQPLLNIFIGHVNSGYGLGFTPWSSSPGLQMYGLDLGDLCIACRDDWFKDIQKTFPKCKLVKMND